MFGFSARAETNVASLVTSGLFEPFGIISDLEGTIFLTDAANNRVVKVPNGASGGLTLAGAPNIGPQFAQPQGLVLARGGLVVADSANHQIRFVSFAGQVTNIAGGAGPNEFGLVNGNGANARFRYPLGLAVDTNGNIFVADSQNNAIRKIDPNNNVTTVAAGFYQPAAVAIGDSGALWVTDTRRHCIKHIAADGTVTLAGGIPNASGTMDSIFATNAQFTGPRGLLWLGTNKGGLLIADSGNNTIRRLFYNPLINGNSVETYAGIPGEAGLENGPAAGAKFNSPVGLTRDLVNGGFFVVDEANNQVRRINTGALQPPVRTPSIGWVALVKDAFGAYVTQLQPVVDSVFNNDKVIAIRAEDGTATYFTVGPTPPSSFEDNVPNPAPGLGQTPPPYRDGAPPSDIPPSMTPSKADMIIKAIGTQDGRRSSPIVQARFQFKVGNPVILGDNGASFELDNVTVGAQMWFTIDGSDPTDDVTANPASFGPRFAGDQLGFAVGESNLIFKARAFRDGFKPSDIVSKEFSPTNFTANKISFGFPNGEASSEFVAAAGQRFYAPVTLSLLAQQKIYSFQFNVVVTNETGPPVDGSLVGFDSTLQKQTPDVRDTIDSQGLHYQRIPPQMFVAIDTNTLGTESRGLVFTNLLVTNATINLLGVGWAERAGSDALYPTITHDLIRYSQPHDTLFDGTLGKVVFGAYSFLVPTNAAGGDAYRIRLGRASGTADGISKDVFIQIPTNGSLTAGAINGTKQVRVGSVHYVVGDVAPFRWFNAGDFGETNLLNNDVLQVFQTAVYKFNLPPAGSDFLDSMDSSDGTIRGQFDGSDYRIDDIKFGDGVLAVDDVFVTFRRSLDPSLKWYARYWSNGVRQAVQVPNGSFRSGDAAPVAAKSTKASKSVMTGTPSVIVSADDVVGSPGTTVQVPIRVRVTGGLPLRVAMFGVTLEALAGSPVLAQPVELIATTALGEPSMRRPIGTNDIAAAWLDNSVAGVSGDAVIATLVVTIPPGAGPSSAYRVHFDHFSGSPNGLGLFRQNVYDGLVTAASRNGSSLNDGIPDSWRLRYFGSVSTALGAAAADADGDGRSNLVEYQAGTNPRDGGSLLRVACAPDGGSSFKVSFPTGTGRIYVLERSSDLNGVWSPISTNAGDGGPREFLDSVSGGTRFYRLRVQ